MGGNVDKSYSKVKSIEEDGYEDVYCLNVPESGNFVANGIVVKNCDSLRYAIATHIIPKLQALSDYHDPQAYANNRFNTSGRRSHFY